MQINQTTIEVVRGSVLDQDVAAIVNAANTALRGGGGVDGAIHRAAGPGLLDELRQIAPEGAKTGTAVLTGGHRLRQKFILHTPGPVWHGGSNGEPELLASCYRACLDLAEAHRIASLAFCSISTGIYGYPIDEAAPLAVQIVRSYLAAHPNTPLRQIVFAMYQTREYDAFQAALKDAP